MSGLASSTTNASRIRGVSVDPSGIANGKVLAYNSTTGKIEYQSPGGAGDLSGYALLVGRPAGQTLCGGTTAGGQLFLKGTSHATPGQVVLKFESTLYDGANDVIIAGYDLSSGSPATTNDAIIAGRAIRADYSYGRGTGSFIWHTDNIQSVGEVDTYSVIHDLSTPFRVTSLGKVYAANFYGGGANLTGLTKSQIGLSNVVNLDTSNASNITSGTLTDSRLSSTAQTNLTLVTNATSSPTASTLVKRDVLGGVQFGVINADTVSAPTIQGTTIYGTNGSMSSGFSVGNLTLSSGSTSINLTDGDVVSYFSVSNLGVVTGIGSGLTSLNGSNISSGTINDLRLSANAQSAVSLRHAAVTLGTANGLSLSTQALSLALATSGAAGAMPSTDKAKLDAATNLNTASTIVMRDGSGNFTAGTITATTFSGSGSSLTGIVPTSRSVSTTAPLTGGGALSGDLTLAISAASGAAAGSMSAAHYTLVNGATSANTASTLVLRDGSGNFSANAGSFNSIENATGLYVQCAYDCYVNFNNNLADATFYLTDYDYGEVLSCHGGTMTISASVLASGLTVSSSTQLNGNVGFFVSPVSRQAATTDIKDALTNYGLLQGTSASPLNLDGGTLTAGLVTTDGITNLSTLNMSLYEAVVEFNHGLASDSFSLVDYDFGTVFTAGGGTFDISAPTTFAGTVATANAKLYNMDRTLPTTTGNAVAIGTFTVTNGGSNLEMWVTIASFGYAQSKRYFFPTKYNGTANTWRKVEAISSTGVYPDSGGQDMDLEININAAVVSLRLRRVLGTTAATAKISLLYQGYAADTFTSSTTSGSATAPTARYEVYADTVLSYGLQLGSSVTGTEGSFNINNWNSSSQKMRLFSMVPTNNGGATPAATHPALVLARPGVNGVAYDNYAEMKVGRYEHSSTNARTKIDFALTHGNGDAAGTNVFGLYSSGRAQFPVSAPPASASAAGNTGDWTWDSTYTYLCIATNTWRRTAHATW